MSEIMDVPLPRAASSALINCERVTERGREPESSKAAACRVPSVRRASTAHTAAAAARRRAGTRSSETEGLSWACGRAGRWGDALKTNAQPGETTRLRGLTCATPLRYGGGAGSYVRR